MSETTTSPLSESTSRLAVALRDHGFVGRLVEPSQDTYDEARACWNGVVDRQPAAVAFASDPDDVAAAISAARAEGMPFTVRAGSHSVSGRSMRDGAVCIDIRGLNSVEVDPAIALVRVGGGALLSEMDAATQEHGLAVPGGQISHTGVGGLTLGGGVGWLMRNHGLTIDSLSRRSRSSLPTARRFAQARRTTRTCSGPCAEEAGTSLPSRRSSSAPMRSGR